MFQEIPIVEMIPIVEIISIVEMIPIVEMKPNSGNTINTIILQRLALYIQYHSGKFNNLVGVPVNKPKIGIYRNYGRKY
ncbi:22223_t:CDS:2 [Rhizophagus irregularis]|nr:22223_t:CDS:2 [Rhizophagus irregularis]